MDSSKQNYSSLFWQLHRIAPNEIVVRIKQHLDDTVSKLNKTKSPVDGLNILTNISHELVSNYILKLLDNMQIIEHTFFVIVGRTFEMLLTKATFMQLTKQEENCFHETGNLIANLCLCEHQLNELSCLDDKNGAQRICEEKTQQLSYAKVFLTVSFFDKLTRIVNDDLAVNNYESYHVKYKVIGNLLSLCTELNTIDHDLLLEPIIKCLQSENYLNAYRALNLRESIISPQQLFFIRKCPEFIRLRGFQRQDEISHALCGVIVKYSSIILEQHLPTSLEGDYTVQRIRTKIVKKDLGAKVQAIGWHIALLNHIALTSSSRPHFIVGTGQTILDHMIRILRKESLIANVYKHSEPSHVDVDLVSWAIVLVHNLAMDDNIFSILKENEFIQICERLQKAKNRTIRFVSMTLSMRLNQGDVGKICASPIIVSDYLFHMENAINTLSLIYRGIKLDTILANLEVLVQNDQIKVEIGNDDTGIQLLMICVSCHKLDNESIRYPALRIIEAILFESEEARRKIRVNDELMNCITSLGQEGDKTIASIANRIQWKVEVEENFLRRQLNKQLESEIKNSPEYHSIDQEARIEYHWDLPENKECRKLILLISCHHSDNNICNQIYDRLAAFHSHEIIFNRESIQEMLPNAMATAVDKSSVILLCFSAKYQESYACRLMVEYAEKRHQSIIGVKVDEFHQPSGWLKKLLDNKPCVECTAMNFNYGIADLLQHINGCNVE